ALRRPTPHTTHRSHSTQPRWHTEHVERRRRHEATLPHTRRPPIAGRDSLPTGIDGRTELPLRSHRAPTTRQQYVVVGASGDTHDIGTRCVDRNGWLACSCSLASHCVVDALRGRSGKNQGQYFRKLGTPTYR